MRIDKAKVRYPSQKQGKTNQEKVNTRPSVFTESYRGEYYNLDVGKLIPYHKQARKYFDEESLHQMAETIKEHGVRQPLTVIPVSEEEGKYEIVSGERRYRAAIIAGLKTVPCIIIHDKKAATEIALIENVQRKDLHPLELAQAYQQLLDEGVCSSQSEIAKKLGLPRSTVSETMKLLTLPEDVRLYILEHKIEGRELFRYVLESNNRDEMLETLAQHQHKTPESLSPTLNKRSKRKVLLKVVLKDGAVTIDTNALSMLSEYEKKGLLEQVMYLLN